MLFFDAFFNMIYNFSNKNLKRDKDNATFSACGILAVYIGFFVGMVAHIIGLIKDNYLSRWALDNAFLAVAPIGLICYITFIIRYDKLIGIENLEKKIAQQPIGKLRNIRYAIYFFLIAVPIGSFVIFRLYMYGHI